jgi:hypothetical protein
MSLPATCSGESEQRWRCTTFATIYTSVKKKRNPVSTKTEDEKPASKINQKRKNRKSTCQADENEVPQLRQQGAPCQGLPSQGDASARQYVRDDAAIMLQDGRKQVTQGL